MDLEIIILSEVNQMKKGKHHMISLIHGISKLVQMNLFTKQTHRLKNKTKQNIITVNKGESMAGGWGG